MPDTTLAYTPAWRLAELIRDRKLSPVELVDHLLQRIERFNPVLNAYLTVCPEEARSAARAAEKGVSRRRRLPPLYGVPVAVKDLIQTKGIRTTGGSLAYKDFVPDEDAPVVERLRRAGAIILGKANTPEFGQSATTENKLGPDCRNPWDTARTCGGSSGGSASAVAAGLGPIALGTDAGGSVRNPSSFCGTYGLKPTRGRVPERGYMGGMYEFNQIGPMARTVRDAAMLLEVIGGKDLRDPYCLSGAPPRVVKDLDRGVKGLRLAWSPALGFAAIDPEVRAVTARAAKAFEGLGCTVEEVPLELSDPFAIFTPMALAQSYQYAEGHLLESHFEDLMPYVRKAIEAGRTVPAHEYVSSLRKCDEMRAKMANLFAKYDLLLTPSNCTAALPIGVRPKEIDGKRVNPLWGAFMMTPFANLTGLPAASVPCGFTRGGLPIGLQIYGRWWQEGTILRASAAYEAAHPWAGKIPRGFE